jgi:hypothetical membrane protein
MQQRVVIGAWCWLLTGQFFIAQIIVQWAFPGYDLARYDISLLGVTGCGAFPVAASGDENELCSPLYWVFNGSVILHGMLSLAGIWLTRDLWRQSLKLGVAGWTLAAGAVGAIGVGLFPLGDNDLMHLISAIFALGAPGIALVFASFGLRGTKPAFANLSLGFGILILVGGMGHALGGWPLDRGIMERLAAWPQTIWYMLAGIALLLRQHTSRPVLHSCPSRDAFPALSNPNV